MRQEVYVPEGERTLRNYTRAELEKARLHGDILEARAVRCDAECNLLVDLGEIKGIIPRDEAVFSPDAEIKNIAVITRVGKSVAFKVIGFTGGESGETTAVLSRREAQKEAYENYISRLRVGDVVRGRITHIERFGAFVDIGCGCVSLIQIDNISISRILHPSDRFSSGDSVFAVVKEVGTDGRITLSHRELLGTWEENAAEFEIGQTAVGKVRSIETYGIFVELTPNLAGLAEYRNDVKVGQSAGVFIKNIIPEKMKIKLVIVDSFNDDSPPSPIRYFVTEGHMERWKYSPENCEKQIFTEFV